MQIKVHTRVSENYRQVLQHFDRGLFLDLAPSFPKFELLRFDGSSPGDIVKIKLSVFGRSAAWSSLITERTVTDSEAWFTDEGQILPWPLKKWKHRHLVTRLSENNSRITDHVRFGTGFRLLDLLIWPALYLAFTIRKPIYRRWFGHF